MTAQKMEEYRSLMHSLISRGKAKVGLPLTDREIRRITEDETKIENQRKRRAAWIAQGLTSNGKVRIRGPRMNLSGWTPEQKRERQLEQQREWNRRQRDNRLGNRH